MTFAAWIAALNAEAARLGYANNPLTAVTGEDCWRQSFDDGMTPVEALAADEAAGA